MSKVAEFAEVRRADRERVGAEIPDAGIELG